jgi:hypothetical protein
MHWTQHIIIIIKKNEISLLLHLFTLISSSSSTFLSFSSSILLLSSSSMAILLLFHRFFYFFFFAEDGFGWEFLLVGCDERGQIQSVFFFLCLQQRENSNQTPKKMLWMKFTSEAPTIKTLYSIDSWFNSLVKLLNLPTKPWNLKNPHPFSSQLLKFS